VIFLLALIPATALTIGGYFVMFLSNRSEGGMRTFGKYLSFWAFTLAALVILGAIFAAASMHRRHGFMGARAEGRMYGPWRRGPGDWGPRMGPRFGPPREGAPPPPPEPGDATPSPPESGTPKAGESAPAPAK
jgi:hypothetical protein